MKHLLVFKRDELAPGEIYESVLEPVESEKKFQQTWVSSTLVVTPVAFGNILLKICNESSRTLLRMTFRGY